MNATLTPTLTELEADVLRKIREEVEINRSCGSACPGEVRLAAAAITPTRRGALYSLKRKGLVGTSDRTCWLTGDGSRIASALFDPQDETIAEEVSGTIERLRAEPPAPLDHDFETETALDGRTTPTLLFDVQAFLPDGTLVSQVQAPTEEEAREIVALEIASQALRGLDVAGVYTVTGRVPLPAPRQSLLLFPGGHLFCGDCHRSGEATLGASPIGTLDERHEAMIYAETGDVPCCEWCDECLSTDLAGIEPTFTARAETSRTYATETPELARLVSELVAELPGIGAEMVLEGASERAAWARVREALLEVGNLAAKRLGLSSLDRVLELNEEDAIERAEDAMGPRISSSEWTA